MQFFIYMVTSKKKVFIFSNKSTENNKKILLVNKWYARTRLHARKHISKKIIQLSFQKKI